VPPSGRISSHGLPRREAPGGAAETAGATGGGEDDRDVGEQGTAGVVQVVRVLVMGQQHHVDRPQVGGVDRAGGGLGEDEVAEGVVARGVEGGVGEEPQASVLDHGGGAAEDPDGDLRGGGTDVGQRSTSRLGMGTSVNRL
jgi:hypothetical protein